MPEKATPFNPLTAEEIATIDRFKIAIGETSVDMLIIEGVRKRAGSVETDREFAINTYKTARRLVHGTDSKSMSGVAFCLRTATKAVIAVDILPDDFIPSPVTLMKCVDNFFADIRDEVKE